MFWSDENATLKEKNANYNCRYCKWWHRKLWRHATWQEVTYFASSSSTCTVRRESMLMSSYWLIPSGTRRGTAATHVRNKSIFGFRSPLQKQAHHLTFTTPRSFKGQGHYLTKWGRPLHVWLLFLFEVVAFQFGCPNSWGLHRTLCEHLHSSPQHL